MEDAYIALYQEFLRLKSLCQKQAAMLQLLTETLRRQQASGLAPVSNTYAEDLVPVQCTYDGLGAAASPEYHAPVGQMKTSSPQFKGDTEIKPIIGEMNKLHLHPEHGDLMQNNRDEAASVISLSNQQEEERSIWDELRQVEQQWHSSQKAQASQRAWASSFMNSEMLSQAGGLMMSRVTLQSQVCEFCHAVFPGHTTTRGEFLRHLTTHIS